MLVLTHPNANPNLDVLTSGSMNAEGLMCTISQPTLVLVAPAIFLLVHVQTNTHITDAAKELPTASDTSSVGNNVAVPRVSLNS